MEQLSESTPRNDQNKSNLVFIHNSPYIKTVESIRLDSLIIPLDNDGREKFRRPGSVREGLKLSMSNLGMIGTYFLIKQPIGYILIKGHDRLSIQLEQGIEEAFAVCLDPGRALTDQEINSVIAHHSIQKEQGLLEKIWKYKIFKAEYAKGQGRRTDLMEQLSEQDKITTHEYASKLVGAAPRTMTDILLVYDEYPSLIHAYEEEGSISWSGAVTKAKHKRRKKKKAAIKESGQANNAQPGERNVPINQTNEQDEIFFDENGEMIEDFNGDVRKIQTVELDPDKVIKCCPCCCQRIVPDLMKLHEYFNYKRPTGDVLPPWQMSDSIFPRPIDSNN